MIRRPPISTRLTHSVPTRRSSDLLMRHEAAGVTTDVFPKKVEWQGVTMALDYHFEPGSPRDGVTLSVPLFALNQIDPDRRSEEHTSELQSLMRISYAVFCLKKKQNMITTNYSVPQLHSQTP